MSCCFKVQKEKYEFSGGDLSGQTRKQSTKVQKRHSKILMNEVPFTLPSGENEDNRQQQKENELVQEKDSGHRTSVPVTTTAVPAGESDTSQSEPEKSAGTVDLETKSPGVTVITITDEEHKSGNSEVSSSEPDGHHQQPETGLTPDMDKNQVKTEQGNSGRNSVDGDKNNNIKTGEVMVITKQQVVKNGLKRTDSKNNEEKDTGKSASSVLTAEKKRNSARINKVVEQFFL